MSPERIPDHRGDPRAGAPRRGVSYHWAQNIAGCSPCFILLFPQST
jgi:hypothetical protein